MLLLPIHAEHHRHRLRQLGDIATEWHDLELMAAGCPAFVRDDDFLLRDLERVARIAMNGEPHTVELPPSFGSVSHEAIEVLVFVAHIAEPELPAGALA